MWNHADEIIKNMNISDIPMGTISNPFEDLEQGWQMIIFEKRGYVYILTDEKGLISSFGGSYETADIEFGFTLSQAREKGDHLAHHLIQSFAPGEAGYEEAHQIGKKLADKVLCGKYAYVLTTHTDKGPHHVLCGGFRDTP